MPAHGSATPRNSASLAHLTTLEVCNLLATTDAGLSAAEAGRRLAAGDPNQPAESRRFSPWYLLLQQFKNALVVSLALGVSQVGK